MSNEGRIQITTSFPALLNFIDDFIDELPKEAFAQVHIDRLEKSIQGIRRRMVEPCPDPWHGESHGIYSSCPRCSGQWTNR